MLKPFANSQLKRLTKTPKFYFCDTGLYAYLSMWLTPEALMNGAASEHYFENYVVMEQVKYYTYSPVKVNMTCCRDSNTKEIDLLIEENNYIIITPAAPVSAAKTFDFFKVLSGF